jgi:hypothetical protein
VAPIRKLKRSSPLCEQRAAFVTCLCLVLGCGPRPQPPAAIEIPPEGSPRHPDGVLIEPPTAIPPATDRAPARGVVALREPLADEAIKEVVRLYVRAWVSEDHAALQQLLTLDAVSLDPGHMARGPLLDAWTHRMHTYDYKKLAGQDVARFERIERYEYAEVGVPGAPARPAEMRPGDALVRVPIATPRLGAEQLFPELLVLLLRREEGRYRIAGVGEENGP